MRKLSSILLFTTFGVVASCVTINVYFPAAAANRAAKQIVREVLGHPSVTTKPVTKTPNQTSPSGSSKNQDGSGSIQAGLLDLLIPTAQAAEPNLDVNTAVVRTILTRMKARAKRDLEPLLRSGAIGFTADGNVAIHDLSAVPLAKRAGLGQIIADANRDRAELYVAIAKGNGHPQWESKIRAIFARNWIEQARPGWYYRNSNGAWRRKR